MSTRKKIGLIGAGNIGGELARLCANEELGDVLLFDIPVKENFAKGKALDLEQNGAVLGYDSNIRGTGNWADLEGADVLIITAGVLDSARFQLFLAREAGVSVKDVRAMVLGGHGDDMVPVLSMTTINGIPATSLIAKDKLDKIIERTRKGGGEIVNLMGTSAYYAPASSAVAMARAYLHDQKRLLPAAAYLEGEYGYSDLFMGVPVVIGGKGIEKIVEIALTEDEKAMLAKSAKSVQAVVDICKKG